MRLYRNGECMSGERLVVCETFGCHAADTPDGVDVPFHGTEPGAARDSLGNIWFPFGGIILLAGRKGGVP